MVLGPAFANALLESGHAVRPTTKQNDSWLLGTRRKKKETNEGVQRDVGCASFEVREA